MKKFLLPNISFSLLCPKAIHHFILILLIFFFTLSSCSPKAKIPPKAVKGVLDLRDWDFGSSKSPAGSGTGKGLGDSKSAPEASMPFYVLGTEDPKANKGDGIVKLDGEWEFYWEEFPTMDENGLLQFSENNKNYIQVPSSWNGYVVQEKSESGEIIEKKIESFGYATYRLKVILPEIVPIGMKIPEMASNCILYYNSHLLLEIGKVGNTEESSVSEKRTNYINFLPKSKEMVLTLLISNYQNNKGGYWGSIFMGNQNAVVVYKQNNIALDLFVAGVLFIMGVYHLSLFYLKRDDLSTLYFGIFCLIMSLRTLIVGENFLDSLLPTIPYSIALKMEFMTFYFGTTIFNEYVLNLLPMERITWIQNFTRIYGILYSLIALLFSPFIFSKVLISFQILLIFSLVYTIYIFIRASINKRLGAKTFLLGFLIFAVVIINDILHLNNIINTSQVVPYGFIFFIFSQAFLLTSRFANAFHEVQDLSENLEKKVVDRTKDLEEQKQQIIEANLNAQKALQKSNDLNQMIQIVVQSKNIDEIFTKIFELFNNRYGLTSYLMYILDTKDKFLKLNKIYGTIHAPKDYISLLNTNHLSIEDKNSVHGHCIKLNKSLLMKKLRLPHLYKPEEENIIQGGITSFYIIPLISDEEVFGTITFSDNKFEKSELQNLSRSNREEIENFIKLVSPSIFQSLQKQQIQSAYSDLNRIKSELENQKSQNERIQEMSQEIQKMTDFNEMLNTLESILWKSYKIGDYCIWIYHPDTNELKSFSLSNGWLEFSLNEKLKNIPLSNDGSIHKVVFDKKKSLFLQKIKNLSTGTNEDFNRELLGIESIFAIPCIIHNQSFAVLSIADLRPEFSKDPNNRGIKRLTPKQRNEIEQLVALIANPLYQSLQKQQIQKAYHDLQETQSQLIEAERLASLGQLVGGIAHEINNPIAAIRSHAELLEKNNRTTLEEIPLFLDSLNWEEKKIFYNIVNTSLDQKEFLTTKEERKLKKDLQKEIETLIPEESLCSTIVDHLTTLRLPPPFETYLETLGAEKFQKFLSMAEVFKSQSNSLSSIEISVEKASRVIFALRSYLNTQLHSEKREIDLVTEVEKALKVYDNYIVGKVLVRKEFPKELTYSCIAENLIQVWKNIIFNSIQATYHTDKKLEIILERVDTLPDSLKSYRTSSIVEDSLFQRTDVKQWILVRFVDSGVGIPTELQEKVFTPFFTTKSTGEGIGLGLYTCKKIVHEHEGAMFFKSENGTTEFVVVLPVG